MVREKRVTIGDIAKEAGVSRGTVDRVLHNRGLVAPKVRESVAKVIKDLNYKPNIYASMLASNKEYKCICLIPNSREGGYWDLLAQGVTNAAIHTEPIGINIEVITYNQLDKDEFIARYKEILEKSPDAVLLAPVYKEEAEIFTSELDKRGVIYSYVDSKIDDNYFAYFGMSSFHSGVLGASILINRDYPDEVACFHIRRPENRSNNTTQLRLNGFASYIKDNCPKCKIHKESLDIDNVVQNRETMSAFFKEHPNVKHIITFNSRVHIIAQYLEENSITDVVLIGYDILPDNRSLLKKGFIDYIITLQPSKQVSQAIIAMSDFLVFKKSLKTRSNFMPMDILTKENIDYYR